MLGVQSPTATGQPPPPPPLGITNMAVPCLRPGLVSLGGHLFARRRDQPPGGPELGRAGLVRETG